MVEHTIGIPEIENEWNTWYTGCIRILLAVPGIQTAQRFTIAGSKPSKYMAIYSITSGDVFDSDTYKKSGGGGNASARFRPAYQSWTRNLFESAGQAPAVAQDRVLVVADRTKRGDAQFLWFPTVGLHQTTPFRGLAILTRDEAAHVPGEAAGEFVVYSPLTPQMSAP